MLIVDFVGVVRGFRGPIFKDKLVHFWGDLLPQKSYASKGEELLSKTPTLNHPEDTWNSLKTPGNSSLKIPENTWKHTENTLNFLTCSAFSLVGLRTQTQNAAFFERKGPERKPWPRGKSLNRKRTIAMRFLNASVLERKSLNRNLSWGLPLG